MTGHDRIWGYCTDCEQDVPIMDDGRGGCGHGRIIRREARDAQMRAEGRVAGLREAYEDFAQEQDRQAEKWQKEANRHRRSDGHRSECEDRDLARRDSCIKRAAEIRALADKIEGEVNG